MLAATLPGAFFAGRAVFSGAPVKHDATAPVAVLGRASAAAMAASSDVAATVRWLEGASLAECEALLAGRSLDKLPVMLREALLLRLAEIDPATLARLIFELPGGGDGISTSRRWLGWLARQRPELLQARIDDPSVPIPQQEVLRELLAHVDSSALPTVEPVPVLEQWLAGGKDGGVYAAIAQLAKSDPELAIRYLSQILASGKSGIGDLSRLVPGLVVANPAAMQALLPSVRTPELRNAIASTLAKVLVRDDPTLAMALYDSLPPSRARSMVAIEIAAGWAQRDPAAALEWVQAKLPDGAAKQAALQLVLMPIAESDPRKVISLLAAGNSGMESMGMQGYQFGRTFPGRTAVLEKAAMALLEEAPQEGMQMLHDLSPPNQSSMADSTLLISKAAGTWLAKDPEAAMGWLLSLPAQEYGFLSVVGPFQEALRGMSPEAAARAAKMLGGLKDENFATNLTNFISASLAAADPAAAMSIADGLPDQLRTRWLVSAIRQQALADPAAASKEVQRLPEAWRPQAHGDIAGSMANSSPQAAMAYLAAVPPAEVNPNLYQQVLTPWAEESWNEVREWWQGLGPEDEVARAGALRVLAGKFYAEDPASAPDLIAGILAIQNQDTRIDSLVELLSEMAKRDPAAALALVDDPRMQVPSWRKDTVRGGVQEVINQAQQ